MMFGCDVLVLNYYCGEFQLMVSVSDEYEITILHLIFILLYQQIRVVMQTGTKSK